MTWPYYVDMHLTCQEDPVTAGSPAEAVKASPRDGQPLGRKPGRRNLPGGRLMLAVRILLRFLLKPSSDGRFGQELEKLPDLNGRRDSSLERGRRVVGPAG